MEHDIEEINVIPLVDIMLVLLVIVLTTASFVSLGQIPVNLAKAHNTAPAQDASVKIALQADGSVYFNQAHIEFKDLPASLAPVSRDTAIIIMADKKLALERFVQVADAVKALGYEKLSLKVERE